MGNSEYLYTKTGLWVLEDDSTQIMCGCGGSGKKWRDTIDCHAFRWVVASISWTVAWLVKDFSS